MGQDLTKASKATLQEQMQFAKLASTATILPEAYRNKPADVLVAVNYGASMGLSFADSLYRINVIKGKPSMSAELIASQVRSAGHTLLPKDEDLQKQSVTVTIIRADMPEYPFRATRDRTWAQSMGLLAKDNYKKQLMTMLYWRALTACAREACPEALYGAYTPDEIQDIPDEVHAEVQPEAKHEAAKEQPEAKPVEPSPSKEDCRKISKLLADGGVDSKEKAAQVLKELTGRDIHSTEQLRVDEAEQLLFSPELVVDRVKQALEKSNA
ncbi:hypothetical protein [Bifidobacterium aquikefiri]|uniref:hypothetical protein n=1 Tax=Bifidobacterium aquikefiri TaxID=1653207 RepID=UPI0039E978F0